jgi:hypothetical protein
MNAGDSYPKPGLFMKLLVCIAVLRGETAPPKFCLISPEGLRYLKEIKMEKETKKDARG